MRSRQHRSPASTRGCDRVRQWGAFVEIELAPNLAVVRWQALKGRVPHSAFDGIERLPSPRRDLWLQAAAGFGAERLAQSAQALIAAGARVAEALDRDTWLAGDDFSLADIAVYPHLAQFPALGFALSAPAADWLQRVAARPSVQLIREDLFPLATMGPAGTRRE